MAPDAVAHSGVREVTCLLCEVLRSLLQPAALVISSLDAIGVGGGRDVARSITEGVPEGSFEARLRSSVWHERDLGVALRAQAGPAALRQFLSSCADCIRPPNVAEIPQELRKASLSYAVEALRLRPFPYSSGIDGTDPLPPLPRARPFDGPSPTCDEEFFSQEFLTAFDDWMVRYNVYHQARLDGRDGVSRPEAFAWDETAVQPRFRGRYVSFCDGIAAPMDPSAMAGQPHVNGAELRRQFAGLADEEIVDLWADGVVFKAEMPFWVVVHPNLLNMWEHVESVTDELEGFRRQGWMRTSGDPRFRFPTFPFFAQPHGAVAKKLGSAPRIIIDMGAPRKLLLAQPSGAPVPSVNIQAGPMRPPKWVKERKPSAAEAALLTAILSFIGEVTGTPLFEIEIDFQKYFHQYSYAMLQTCSAGAVVPRREMRRPSDPDGPGPIARCLSIESCLVMAIGATPASEIAQRGSNSLNGAWLRRMDAAELEFAKERLPALSQWLVDRSRLTHDSYGTQARLSGVHTYSDDPRLLMLGTRRTVRGLTEFWDLAVRLLCLRLAGPEKWHLGTSGLWVGIHFSGALGLAWFSKSKVAKALHYIAGARAGRLAASTWREMLGFLEHVWSLLQKHRYTS